MLPPSMVHVSTPGGLPNRSSDGSYPSSTRRDGLSDRQNVLRRVDIAGVVRPALGTDPSAHTQRERGQQMPTGGTGFATRIPSVDCHDRNAGRLRFGLNHTDRGANRGVRQGTGQAVVLNQAPEMQVFEIDRVKPSHERRAECVQAVPPSIGNLLVQPGHAPGLLPVSIRASLLPGQPALGAGQQGGPSKEMLRIGHGLSGREGRQAGHTEVDTDRQTGRGPLHDCHLDDHRDVVAARRMPRDRHRTGVGRHRPTETQRQHPELGKGQALGLTVEPEGAAGV